MAESEMPPPPPVAPLDLRAAGRLVGALMADEPVEDDAEFRRLPRIRGYRPRRRLGSGGGGVVFEATAEATGARVAVKVLHQGASAPPQNEGGSAGAGPGEVWERGRGTRRAWRELDLLTQLRLAAVPRTLDYGYVQGRLYIVTEYVDGLALDEFCGMARGAGAQGEEGERPPLPLRHRVALLARVAEAVQSLHEHGILHRDLKPSNILIDARGNPAIIDLGIATLVNPDVLQTLTADGAPVGTPAFMAPEQARGEREAISTRSDVYSLGATACLILTGQTPHELGEGAASSLAAAVHRVAHDRPRDPLELDPALPRPLAAVVSRATDPDPGRRYASAGEMGEDLRRWLRGEAVLASPPPAWERAARWVGRHPVVATASLCAALLVLTTVATVLVGRVAYLRPHGVVVDPATRSRVDVVTITGRSLEHWAGGQEGSALFAALMERPTDSGRARTVVIGWDSKAMLDEAGTLAGYDLANPRRPLWKRGIGDVDLRQPEPSPDGYANQFRLRQAVVADVFPERAGEEIIAVHTHHPYSPSAIRVYDAAGEVLYEVWHDGHIAAMHWLAGAGLVVVDACNSDAKWPELGYPELVDSHWPRVLFAVRPRLGEREGFIATPDGIGEARAAWYKFLCPPEVSNMIPLQTKTLERPPPSYDQRTHFRWNFRLPGPSDVSGTLILDSAGRLVGRFHSDMYPSPGRPELAEFELVDAPPRR